MLTLKAQTLFSLEDSRSESRAGAAASEHRGHTNLRGGEFPLFAASQDLIRLFKDLSSDGRGFSNSRPAPLDGVKKYMNVTTDACF